VDESRPEVPDRAKVETPLWVYLFVAVLVAGVMFAGWYGGKVH
jgi:hypothetical protein